MHPITRRAAASLFSLLLTAQTHASQAGWRNITLPALSQDNAVDTTTSAAIPVALFYPTPSSAIKLAMGPFTLEVAPRAQPEAGFKGLIVLSHGTGGSELGHSSLAQALARSGYLVAALRHPGDNWEDRSLLAKSPVRFFSERPQHVSRVIDALLSDPDWGPRIASDTRGPRIGALGHSAGGYTALALAGGQADLSRIAKHCAERRAEDPIFCSMGRSVGSSGGPGGHTAATPNAEAAAASRTVTADKRIRAAVAMAPVGVVFTAASLASIRVPTLILEAENDRFLVPAFHTAWVAQHVPNVQLRRIPRAWHFAFMDRPSMPIPTEDGDIAADPPGFDRDALLSQLQQELPAFFDRAWAAP